LPPFFGHLNALHIIVFLLHFLLGILFLCLRKLFSLTSLLNLLSQNVEMLSSKVWIDFLQLLVFRLISHSKSKLVLCCVVLFCLVLFRSVYS